MHEELKLDVFISWSGHRAGLIADRLKKWLEVAFQFTRPFLSKEIVAGRRWSQDLSKALERCNFGILILTPESIRSEWLLFEAGALAKHLGESRVVPLLVDLSISDLRPPLSEFQAVRLDHQLESLAKSLNQAQPDPWPADQLRDAFSWTSERFLSDVLQLVEETRPPGTHQEAGRPIGEVLDEILQTVKHLHRAEKGETVDSSEQNGSMDYSDGEQYYPVNDRILLYKFLKARVKLPLYKNASMPALFDAAARFIQKVKPSMNDEKALSIVAKYLVSERPLQELLDGLRKYESESK